MIYECMCWYMPCVRLVSCQSPTLVPSSLSIFLCAPAFFLCCIVSAENYATIFLLCLGNFVHCWLIHSHSKQKANVWAITHMHTHTLPLFLPVFPSLALPVISAGKSKHFKLSILRVTSPQLELMSAAKWVGVWKGATGEPPSDLALEMLFVKKMVSFGYNINPIASFVFDKYKNSYLAIWDFQHLLWYIRNLQVSVFLLVFECAWKEFQDFTKSVHSFCVQFTDLCNYLHIFEKT